MKKYYKMFRFCIIVSLIITGILVTNTVFLSPQSVMCKGSEIDMKEWTYSTSTQSNKKVTLPFIPEDNIGNSTIHITSNLPNMINSKTLLMSAYMKDIKVYIKGEMIYNSKCSDNKVITKGVGRGLYFVNIPVEYSGEKIDIEVFSLFPQSDGIIDSVSLADKATHITNMIQEYAVDNIIAFAMIFIGIVSISIFLATFLGSDKYINLLCIGVFAICCGFWILAQTNLYQILYNSPYIGYVVEFISFYSMPIPLLVFVNTTYKIKNSKVITVLITLFTGFLILVLLSQFLDLLQLHESINIYNFLLAVSMPVLMYVLILEIIGVKAWRKNKDFLVFFIGFNIMIIFAAIDLFLFYTSSMKIIGSYFKVGVLAFTLTLCITIGRHIIRLNKEKIKNQTLMDIAYKDLSTGIYNRRAFDEEIDRLNSKINEISDITLLVFDLDNLKKTNDSDGHIEGDKIINKSATILKDAYKEIGDAYRVGGDEFVIICINKTPEEIENGTKKKKLLIEKINLNSERSIGISYGKASYNSSIDKDLYDVFSRADKYMYNDKRKRKETVTL